MSVGGKRDGFTRADLVKAADDFGIRQPGEVIDAVTDSVSKWLEISGDLNVPDSRISSVRAIHGLDL